MYPCYETAEDLDLKRKSLLSRGKPPIYDRAALKLTDADRKELEEKGIKPHWRFRLDHREVVWQDLIRGETRFHGEHLSDPILVRENGTFVYMMPSVVDDGELGITHVLRGEDHVTNTAIQIQLAEALGYTPPQFGHFPLLSATDGGKLSKRKGSLSVRDLRVEGFVPMTVNSFLARLGSSDPIEAHGDMESLIRGFDVSRFARNTPKFDEAELESLNAKVLHMMPFDRIAGELENMGITDVDGIFWEAVRANLCFLKDIRQWRDICHGVVTPVIDDPDFTRQAAELLPAGIWDTGTWAVWTEKLKAVTRRKGRELFLPLRLALTGREHGPELAQLLPLIGRSKAIARLTGQAA
jgi:glutamyl-tRNA synthetase